MRKTAEHDEAEYRKHNVTRREVKPNGDLIREPVSHDMQCGCDSCRAHRRRASVTGVADPHRSI